MLRIDFGAARSPMKRLMLVLFVFAGELFPARAEPFQRAEVTKAINVVSLLPQSTRASRAMS